MRTTQHSRLQHRHLDSAHLDESVKRARVTQVFIGSNPQPDGPADLRPVRRLRCRFFDELDVEMTDRAEGLHRGGSVPTPVGVQPQRHAGGQGPANSGNARRLARCGSRRRAAVRITRGNLQLHRQMPCGGSLCGPLGCSFRIQIGNQRMGRDAPLCRHLPSEQRRQRDPLDLSVKLRQRRFHSSSSARFTWRFTLRIGSPALQSS